MCIRDSSDSLFGFFFPISFSRDEKCLFAIDVVSDGRAALVPVHMDSSEESLFAIDVDSDGRAAFTPVQLDSTERCLFAIDFDPDGRTALTPVHLDLSERCLFAIYFDSDERTALTPVHINPSECVDENELLVDDALSEVHDEYSETSSTSDDGLHVLLCILSSSEKDYFEVNSGILSSGYLV